MGKTYLTIQERTDRISLDLSAVESMLHVGAVVQINPRSFNRMKDQFVLTASDDEQCRIGMGATQNCPSQITVGQQRRFALLIHIFESPVRVLCLQDLRHCPPMRSALIQPSFYDTFSSFSDVDQD